MFDINTVRLYRSISAPEQLQSRIERLAGDSPSIPAGGQRTVIRRRRLAGMAGTLAACAAALIFTIGFPRHTARLTVDGLDPAKSAVAVSAPAAAARNMPMPLSQDGESLSLTLSFDISGQTEISVSSGLLYDDNSEGASTRFLSKNAALSWQLEDVLPEDIPYIELAGNGAVQRYELVKDANAGVWYLIYAAP